MSTFEEPVGCNTVGTVSFLFGLAGGTASSIVIKILYEMTAKGSEGTVRNFEKPLFLTFVMFLAMAFALPCYVIQESLKTAAERSPRVPGRVLWSLCIPAIFDLLGTNLAQAGLLFTSVSYFQLLRCTVIVVTVFLKAFVLHQRLAKHMWWGVAINIVAMVLVSVTNFVAPENVQPDYAKSPSLGVFFILLSCVVQGSQYIFEEKVMAVDDAPPLVVIGMEGVWGTAIMLLLLPIAAALPGRDLGSVEDTTDSINMVWQSRGVQVMLLVFFVTISTYNAFSIYVTAHLSATWHAILDNFRPVSVWVADLFIFYVITDGSFGEAWTAYSWLQLFGMLVLFLGTAVYNGSLKLPFLDYGEEYAAFAEDVEAPIPAGMHKSDFFATTAVMKSPPLRRGSREHESPLSAFMLAARAVARREANVMAGEGVIVREPRALSSERQELIYGNRSVGEMEYGTAV